MSKPLIHAIAGLPRSGSTLLTNVLIQNKDLYCTPTSGLLAMLTMVRHTWDNIPDFKANPNDNRRIAFLSGAAYGYFADVSQKLILDKARGWPHSFELADLIFNNKMKVIITVRDMRDVLSSFEKLYRENKGKSPVPGEQEQGNRFLTIEGRCEVWSSNIGPVGSCYNIIKDAMNRGFTNRMCFVEYEKFTAQPRVTMQKIYDFLEQPFFEHNFENVEQVLTEDDTWYGWGVTLHKIRPRVEPSEPSWPKFLPKMVADKYASNAINFWRT